MLFSPTGLKIHIIIKTTTNHRKVSSFKSKKGEFFGHFSCYVFRQLEKLKHSTGCQFIWFCDSLFWVTLKSVLDTSWFGKGQTVIAAPDSIV